MKKNKLKFFLLLIGVSAVFTAVFLYFYLYKDHRNIAQEKAQFTLSVAELSNAFLENSEESSQKFADKTIETYGKISSVDTNNNSLMVDEKLFFTLSKSDLKDLRVNQTIKVKGRFVGYDDLLEELKMDQCSIVK
ncbi:hypothetical protein [Flavobacterium filum]|uniref:OB-fold protein n=1 Tax=Flavobacterium TaxID=237 RepID=UPI0003F7D3A7|nr:hypothetical protein [Flavobacterium filum]